GRDDVYTEYKGTRDKMPDDLRVQLDRINEVVRAFNIPVLALEGYEADDIIGTVTAQAVEQGVQVHVITGDRDLLQLLQEHVVVQLPTFKGADEVFDVRRFIEKYSINPPQLVDYKALVGDTSDNIPGVKGIGEKSAAKLLQDYQTLDGIYENIAVIGGSLQKKLIDGRESAYMSRYLAQIQQDVPIQLNLPACVAHEFDANVVLEVFEQVEFRSLRDRLIRLTTPQTQSMFGTDDFSNTSGDDFGSDEDFAPPAHANQQLETIIVRDEEALDEMVAVLNAAELISFDTETTGTDQMLADLVGISLSVQGGIGYYIPVGHREGHQLPLQRVIDALQAPMTNPKIAKVAHNANYDLVILQRYGIDVAPITFDTMIAEWVLDPLSKFLGLKNLVYDRLRDDTDKPIYMTPIADLIGKGKTQITMAEVPIDQAAPYAAADTVMTYRLVDKLRPRLDRDSDLLHVFNTLEIPLIPVIASMEQAGVVLDIPYLAELAGRLNTQLKILERDIREIADIGTLNINSPKQLSDMLFNKLGMPTKGIKKTTLGYSTDAAVLDSLLDAHPIIPKIMEYRELAKLQGTYVEALPRLINPRTGRVHTSYNQTGSSTGRLSSNNPNLQNIPIRTEIGREVRRAFLAPPGKVLLSVDYSQVELRILAHISRDATLIDAFSQGLDIHAATAAAVTGIPVEEVTYNQRSFAKRVNFGLIYGMGAFRLARDSNLTLAEADAFIKRYFERLPGVQKYLNDTKRLARDPQGLRTLLGRRRTFPVLIGGTGNRNNIQAEERVAINMPIQGSAADIMKKAMIEVFNELNRRQFKAMLSLQVHDELVLEVPEDEVDAVKNVVIDVMEQAYPLDPALRANASTGKNWLDMA
ncbi:MAG: DNA polymerase I, partial [Anaerolineae bacterium]|nr:DNA polymerase I [Anaerolineae bacterium]